MLDPRKSVFINCPYDQAYEPFFNALVLAVVGCGFTPRTADETGVVAKSRMDRIFDALSSSAYSIHDLSRCQGDGAQMLARFNMPLELGIAMAKHRSASVGEIHEWLAVVPSDAPYAKFISDLAGYDLPKYETSSPEGLVKKVMAWLVTRPMALEDANPRMVIKQLNSFGCKLAKLQADWGEIPWHKFIEAAIDCLNDNSDTV